MKLCGRPECQSQCHVVPALQDCPAVQALQQELERLRAAQRSVMDTRLRAAAERVCWFDWSGNDPDAAQAIDELRREL